MGQKPTRYIVKENYKCHDTGMEIQKGDYLLKRKKQQQQENGKENQDNAADRNPDGSSRTNK